MKKNRIKIAVLVSLATLTTTTMKLNAQAPVQAGEAKYGITQELLSQIKSSYKGTATDKALQNMIVAGGMDFANARKAMPLDGNFSHKVQSLGITDQKQSGRCWLFTGLNVLRAEAMQRHNLGELIFSQNYNYFWDQLEKSNLFLQAIIDTRNLPSSDRRVDWLFAHPINDGGQFTGISDNFMKYGIVPSDVMPETASSNNTGKLSNLIGQILRQEGIRLREDAQKGKKENDLLLRKQEALSAIYRILVLNLGEPTQKFVYTLKDKEGKVISTKEYTPQSFYKALFSRDMRNSYVMLMNNPTLPYNKVYAIEYDRHMYDGANWTYLNLPMEEIKKMAIASIKDNTMMYYSCDVGKQLDRKTGILTLDNFDYSSMAGITLDMDKKERIATGASGSTHAMTLMAVDLDAKGKPTKWMVENSWGATSGYKGHLIMSDEWFDAYTFRLVVDKKYLTPQAKALLNQKAELLPPWDPMFSPDK